MAVESDADRLAFLVDFGVSATFGVDTVTGLFDNEYISVFTGDVVDVESSSPAFTCRTSDVPSISHGYTLTVNATAYTVHGVQPDGEGFTVLVLEAPC